jgi:hypothetical protein
MAKRPDEDKNEPVLTEDDTDNRETEQLLADGELVGTWSDEDQEEEETLLAGDESVGPWSEDDLEFGLRADSADEDDIAEEESVDEAGDADVDQLSDMPDPKARR